MNHYSHAPPEGYGEGSLVEPYKETMKTQRPKGKKGDTEPENQEKRRKERAETKALAHKNLVIRAANHSCYKTT